MHTCIHTCIHTYIRIYTRTYVYIQKYIRTCMKAYMNMVLIHTYIRIAYIHTYIHTYTCIHTCVCMKTRKDDLHRMASQLSQSICMGYACEYMNQCSPPPPDYMQMYDSVQRYLNSVRPTETRACICMCTSSCFVFMMAFVWMCAFTWFYSRLTYFTHKWKHTCIHIRVLIYIHSLWNARRARAHTHTHTHTHIHTHTTHLWTPHRRHTPPQLGPNFSSGNRLWLWCNVLWRDPIEVPLLSWHLLWPLPTSPVSTHKSHGFMYVHHTRQCLDLSCSRNTALTATKMSQKRDARKIKSTKERNARKRQVKGNLLKILFSIFLLLLNKGMSQDPVNASMASKAPTRQGTTLWGSLWFHIRTHLLAVPDSIGLGFDIKIRCFCPRWWLLYTPRQLLQIFLSGRIICPAPSAAKLTFFLKRPRSSSMMDSFSSAIEGWSCKCNDQSDSRIRTIAASKPGLLGKRETTEL